MIKLARVGYTKHSDEIVLDITVKNNPNHVLSPTWDIVLGFMQGKISWPTYVERYLKLIRKRWTEGRKQELLELSELSTKKTLVLVCFCKDETRCHRSIAKSILEKIAQTQ